MTAQVTVHGAAFTFLNGDTDLETRYVRVGWFEQIASGTSGAITVPPGGEIILDAFAGGVDALVSTVENAWPSFDSPLTAGGSVVAATLDGVGNWTLSGTPSAYPVALIYQYRTLLTDLDDSKMFGVAMADTIQDVSVAATPTFAGVRVNGFETLKHVGTPSAPAAGYSLAYFKSDGVLYSLSSGNTEVPVGGQAVGLDKQVQWNDAGAVAGSAHFTFNKNSNSVIIGENAVILPDNPLALSGSVDSYLQLNMQNHSAGTSASSDVVLTADDGTDTQFYADFGISNSTYAAAAWDIAGPHDTYLWGDGGHLVLGSLSAGKTIKFFVAGTEHEAHPADIKATLSGTGFNIPTGLTYNINGVPINRFTSLTDAPSSFTGHGDKVVYVNTGGTALEFRTPSAATTFLGLSDTPSSYSGQGSKAVRVNAGATALEFFTLSGGGDMLASVYDPGAVAANVFSADNHIDGTTNKVFTATEKTKLAGVATGAEVNVNADWNSGSGDSQILNKPSAFAPTSHGNAAHTEPFAIEYHGTGSPPTAVGKADGTLFFKYV